VVPSTPVKPAVPTVEPADVVPTGVVTVMHCVVSMPMIGYRNRQECRYL